MSSAGAAPRNRSPARRRSPRSPAKSAALAREAGRAVDRSETRAPSRRPWRPRCGCPTSGEQSPASAGRARRRRPGSRTDLVTSDLDEVGQTCCWLARSRSRRSPGLRRIRSLARCRRTRRRYGQLQRLARLQQLIVRGSASEPMVCGHAILVGRRPCAVRLGRPPIRVRGRCRRYRSSRAATAHHRDPDRSGAGGQRSRRSRRP